jgi:hypothetical protein
MAEKRDNLVLPLLCTMRAENSTRCNETEAVLKETRPTVTTQDLRFYAPEERVEAIREGTVSAIGFAANAGRPHVDLRKQIAGLTRRVEKLEARR